MTQKQDFEIHETAFLTSTLRSYCEELGHDIYAKLWNQENHKQWIEEYLQRTSTEEDTAHCLRNRYFLDTIKQLAQEKKIEALINFGCGLSMYPFLIDQELIHIEIDKTELIDFKQFHINNWQEEGALPKRKVHYLGVDFSHDFRESLFKRITDNLKGKSCFILLEGVLFFLNQEQTDQLFSFFDSIQNPGDYIGSVSFQDSFRQTRAWKRLMDFVEYKLSNPIKEDYHTLSDDYYRSLPNYQLIDQQDFFSMSKKHNIPQRLERDLILNENFYLLEKVASTTLSHL